MNTHQIVKYTDAMVNMFESEWNKNTKGMNPSGKGILVVLVVVILWVIIRWIF